MSIKFEQEENIYDRCFNVVKHGTVIEVNANPILHINPKRTVKGAYCNYIYVPIFI